MNEIVVGVDESPDSRIALEWALREADLRRQPLTAVLAWGLLNQHHAGSRTDDTFDPHYDEAAARAALDVFVDDALSPADAARVGRRVVCDLPAPGLLAAAADASLLVVGSRGRGGFAGLLLGSVSQQCAHHARGPIAVVRAIPERQEGRGERIVVGVDGSCHARRALHWAVEEARIRDAALQVVHAWHAPAVAPYPYASAQWDPGGLEDAGRQILRDAVAGEDMHGLSHPVERLLACSSAAGAILDAAQDADLVVVGSRGLGGFKGLLLGSTSHQVVHHARCPVVIIPPEG